MPRDPAVHDFPAPPPRTGARSRDGVVPSGLLRRGCICLAACLALVAGAAQAAAKQAAARYDAGLGNIDAVAEAQRLVAQAEIDEALARLGVWRGLLAVAAAAGDIQPFLEELSR